MCGAYAHWPVVGDIFLCTIFQIIILTYRIIVIFIIQFSFFNKQLFILL